MCKTRICKNKKINCVSVAIIIIVLGLLTVTVIHAHRNVPKINKRIDDVYVKYQELEKYVDEKFPVIDSVLLQHTKQLIAQHKQLNELNNLIIPLETDK